MRLASRIISCIALLVACASARAEILATYLGNEGVLIEYEGSKIVFDPLYRNDYDLYELVPQETREALMSGAPPFDGPIAVFVSHFHGDHFSAEDLATLLERREDVRLYAPAQAVAEMTNLVSSSEMSRIVGIDLEYKDEPVTLSEGALAISAVRIPHSGWPSSRTDVQNLAWRVTLNDYATVAHFGDADTRDEHYAQDADYWAAETIDMAFPPYWYFTSARGQHVLTNRLKPRHSIGIHVPVKMPDDRSRRPENIRSYDLFTEPGQTRRMTANPD